MRYVVFMPFTVQADNADEALKRVVDYILEPETYAHVAWDAYDATIADVEDYIPL